MRAQPTGESSERGLRMLSFFIGALAGIVTDRVVYNYLRVREERRVAQAVRLAELLIECATSGTFPETDRPRPEA